MKTKLPVLALFILHACLARAAFYVEPRVSYLHIAGTPNIADLGAVQNSDTERFAPGIALGYTLTPRLGLELRYTALGEVSANKVSPDWKIFPTDNPVIAIPHYYRYVQETSVTSLALPFQLVDAKKITVWLTPLVQRAEAKVELWEQSPNVLLVAGGGPIHHRRETPVRAGGEISAAYALGTRAAVTVHYTYLPLPGFDAHLFGAGFTVRF
jgi:hypothetical protein